MFRFGGNHSPRGVKLRQVGAIAFASAPRSLTKQASGEPGGRVGATRIGWHVRGVTFRSECEGMRWDLADAVTGRGGVPPVEPTGRTKADHAPLRRGALRGVTDSGRRCARRSALLRGKACGGWRARSPAPRPHPPPRRQPSRAGAGPVDRVDAAPGRVSPFVARRDTDLDRDARRVG